MCSTSSTIFVLALLVCASSSVQTQLVTCELNEIFFADLQACAVPETMLLTVRRTSDFPSKAEDGIVFKIINGLHEELDLELTALQVMTTLSMGGDTDILSTFIFLGQPLLTPEFVEGKNYVNTLYDVIIFELSRVDEQTDNDLNVTLCYDRADVSIDSNKLSDGPSKQDQYLDTLFDFCQNVGSPIMRGPEGTSSDAGLRVTWSRIMIVYILINVYLLI